MIPIFPKFKKLELSDREHIEKITSKHAPHSDYNFLSMWSWDVRQEMEISQLYNNLVVKFSHYITSEPFFSFLGNINQHQTAETLLEFSKDKNLCPALSLVPAESIESLDPKKFIIKPDEANFDYIYELSNISLYPGRKFGDKRTMVNSFLKNYSSAVVKIFNLTDLDCQKSIITLNNNWLKNKAKIDENFKIKNEFIATEKFLSSNFHDAIGIGIFIDKKLIAYSIFNLTSDNYAVAHFSKADIAYDGVYEYLMRECATILLDLNCKFLNYQQDLGLSGLKQSKKSFRPTHYLKKYMVQKI